MLSDSGSDCGEFMIDIPEEDEQESSCLDPSPTHNNTRTKAYRKRNLNKKPDYWDSLRTRTIAFQGRHFGDIKKEFTEVHRHMTRHKPSPEVLKSWSEDDEFIRYKGAIASYDGAGESRHGVFHCKFTHNVTQLKPSTKDPKQALDPYYMFRLPNGKKVNMSECYTEIGKLRQEFKKTPLSDLRAIRTRLNVQTENLGNDKQPKQQEEQEPVRKTEQNDEKQRGNVECVDVLNAAELTESSPTMDSLDPPLFTTQAEAQPIVAESTTVVAASSGLANANGHLATSPSFPMYGLPYPYQHHNNNNRNVPAVNAHGDYTATQHMNGNWNNGMYPQNQMSYEYGGYPTWMNQYQDPRNNQHQHYSNAYMTPPLPQVPHYGGFSGSSVPDYHMVAPPSAYANTPEVECMPVRRTSKTNLPPYQPDSFQ